MAVKQQVVVEGILGRRGFVSDEDPYNLESGLEGPGSLNPPSTVKKPICEKKSLGNS